MQYINKIKEKLIQGYYFKERIIEQKHRTFKYYEVIKKVGNNTFNIAYQVAPKVIKLFYAPIVEKALKKVYDPFNKEKELKGYTVRFFG